MSDSPSLAANLADLLSDQHPAGSLPQRICVACINTLAVTGAGISMLVDTGSLTTLGTSDAAAAKIEELQFTVGVGPCVDAVNSGGPVLVRDLADGTDPVGGRWPEFSTAAVEAGVRAVFAFPLIIGAITLGVIDLYRDTPGMLTADELSRALLVADAAALALLDLRAAVSPEPAAGEPSDTPLNGGAFQLTEVYQATGMIMIQLGVAVEVALARLRAYAFANGRPIGEVARDVVARRLRLESDAGE
jgi:GAF domain/ANTAR domain